jgi:hypothetical protein
LGNVAVRLVRDYDDPELSLYEADIANAIKFA